MDITVPCTLPLVSMDIFQNGRRSILSSSFGILQWRIEFSSSKIDCLPYVLWYNVRISTLHKNATRLWIHHINLLDISSIFFWTSKVYFNLLVVITSSSLYTCLCQDIYFRWNNVYITNIDNLLLTKRLYKIKQYFFSMRRFWNKTVHR